MAHRAHLLGTAFTTTFDWDGPQPRLLEFLRSPAGTFYRVVGIQEKENPLKLGLTLERIREPHPRELNEHATHDFWWHPRDRGRAG